MRILGMLAGLALLAGCAVDFVARPLDRQAELAALREARPPFATFDTLAYERVAVPSFTFFQIMRGSEVMDVSPHGRTFAKGFELPAGPEGLQIDVASHLVPGRRAFHPIVTLLDQAWNPIRSTWQGTVRVEQRANHGWGLVLPVQITPEERVRVRYLVVHTSQDLVALPFALMGETRATPQIGTSPSGYVSLTITEKR